MKESAIVHFRGYFQSKSNLYPWRSSVGSAEKWAITIESTAEAPNEEESNSGPLENAWQLFSLSTWWLCLVGVNLLAWGCC